MSYIYIWISLKYSMCTIYVSLKKYELLHTLCCLLELTKVTSSESKMHFIIIQ